MRQILEFLLSQEVLIALGVAIISLGTFELVRNIYLRRRAGRGVRHESIIEPDLFGEDQSMLKYETVSTFYFQMRDNEEMKIHCKLTEIPYEIFQHSEYIADVIRGEWIKDMGLLSNVKVRPEILEHLRALPIGDRHAIFVKYTDGMLRLILNPDGRFLRVDKTAKARFVKSDASHHHPH